MMLIPKRIGGLAAAIGLALGLGACTDGYGYGGLNTGYVGYYDDGYGDYGYGNDYVDYGGFGYGNGGGFGLSNFGWNDNFFYPGTGIYVYDRFRRPFRWNGAQQRYWQGRQRYRGRDWNGQGSWNGFYRDNRGGRTDGQSRGNDRDWQNVRNDANRDGRRIDGSWPGRRDRDGQGRREWRGNRDGMPGGQGYRSNRNGTPGAQGYSGNPGVRAAPGNRGDGVRVDRAPRSTAAPQTNRADTRWSGRSGGERSSAGRPGRAQPD